MLAPDYIQRGLRGIDSMYFAIFNPCILDRKSMSAGRGRWQVRKWGGIHPKRLDLWDTESEVIMTICKEEMTDRGLVDPGYEEMDIRVVTAIRKSNHWKNQWKKKIAELDWSNEKLERQANDELDYQSKYVARQAWHMEREPTVNLSGKEWKV